MSASLVGSEMCIRDRLAVSAKLQELGCKGSAGGRPRQIKRTTVENVDFKSNDASLPHTLAE
eukprot:7361441-Alexandrium_andersonii.AAC.1